ncbi:MAG: hypothetical protein HKO91_08555, partial [Desulfobacterales bacterium]|nr:hypothetical protein [Desulfobacterales bacterium]
MIAIIAYYIFFGLVLVIYETQICPFLECSGYLEALKNTFGPVLLLLPLRVYLFNWHQRKINVFGMAQNPALFSLPWREFITDLVVWLLAGLGIGFVFVFYSHVPVLTVLKVILGCVAFGLFGGMLCFLSMERRIIEFLKTEKAEVAFTPKRMFSVSRKMLFFTITVLLFMVMAILLMAFMNINYLLDHKGFLRMDFFFSFFKEILFAFSILFVLSLFILARYSQNLKANLSIQLGVMEDI